MNERYVCIHGHFYQPPRENPWLETVEIQESAYPYHDWNERITAECYAPNADSRILDAEGRIVKIVNNYSRISFNFGPTLLSWLEAHAPDTYGAILRADRESAERFAGHGSALAQIYNHVIMPLASRRDKRTQVSWGIRDFEHRFGRKPEGMWLSETAVDLETLDVLAELGIRFTILAPHQAKRVRTKQGGRWRDVGGGRIDTTIAYEVQLPSKRTISVFFYDGETSRAVAFHRLLDSGESFATRVLGALPGDGSEPGLAHIATDGETYGHHHRFGDMALAYALDRIEAGDAAELINYGAFLEKHPPTHWVEIEENTSWSCSHGIERWRGDCGCSTGSHPDWRQAWRAPLREALDWLRDSLAPVYEKAASRLFHDPWSARDGYIDVLFDRSPGGRDRFLSRYAGRRLSGEERIAAWRLLELQRHAMLMFTSCGWFFDEPSRIETVQVLTYAARSIQLARELPDIDLTAGFAERLETAPSNLPEIGDVRRIYERQVVPAIVDLKKAGAHFAVSGLFDRDDIGERVFGYDVDLEDRRIEEAGKAKLTLGRMRVTSTATLESKELCFGFLHFGDHNLTGGVHEFREEAAHRAMIEEVSDAFSRAELPEVVRLLDKHFLELTYSLKSLFRDEQRRILESVLGATLEEATAVYGQLYESHAPLMRFLTDLGMPVPAALRAAGEVVLDAELRAALAEEEIDLPAVRRLLNSAREESVDLDAAGLSLAFVSALEREMARLKSNVTDVRRLQNLRWAASLARDLPLQIDLWRVQNDFYRLRQRVYPDFVRRAGDGDPRARDWVSAFLRLAEILGVNTD